MPWFRPITQLRSPSFSILFTAAILVAGCGSSEDNSSSSGSPIAEGLPPIVIGEPNPVVYDDGEFHNAFAAVEDAANNRWLVADRALGILGVNKDTKAVSVIAAITPQNTISESSISVSSSSEASSSASEESTLLTAITDIALDTDGQTLYVLDAIADSIFSLDLASDTLAVVATKDDFANLPEGFAWESPLTIAYDSAGQRLLIGDNLGITSSQERTSGVRGFALYALNPATKATSVVAASENIASPFLFVNVRDMVVSPTDNTIYVSGLQFASASGALNYSVYRIDLDTWQPLVLYPNGGTVNSSDSLLNAIIYSERHNALFSVNPSSRSIQALQLDNLDAETPTLAIRTVTTIGGDKPFPLIRPSFLTESDNSVVVFDETFRAAFKLNTDDLDDLFASSSSSNSSNSSSSQSSSSSDSPLGDRELIFSGIPVREDNLSYPLQPADIVVLDNGQLVATDRFGPQSDAFVIAIDEVAATRLDFQTDVTAITATEITFSAPAEGQTIAAPEIDSPKPLRIAVDITTGDTLVYALAYRTVTTDPLKQNEYSSAIYRQQAGQDTFLPVTTLDSDGKIFIAELQSAFTRNTVGISAAVRHVAASPNGVYMAVQLTNGIWDIWFWRYSDKTIRKLDTASSPYNPQGLTGMVYDHIADRLLFVDSQHDALVAFDASDNHEKPSENLPTEVSGRVVTNKDWEYMSSPSGLVITADGSTTYTFDTNIRALIKINLSTGERTRLDSERNLALGAFDLALSSDETELFMVERNTSRLLAINLVTLEQRWLDKATN